MDGDGIDDLLVGVPDADPGARFRAGSAYVYSGATGILIHQFDGRVTYDELGHSVSGAGDVDGDGFDDVIVGAPQASPGSLNKAGSAYLYSGASGSLLYQFDGDASADLLGYSVSGAGDVDGDGFDDLIVGAHGTNQDGQDMFGSAYVYSGATGAILHQFDGQVGMEGLGRSVSGAGDVDGDGFDDLIVGAPSTSLDGMAWSGAVYVYSGATGAILHQFYGQPALHELGASVSGAGDANGDGFDDFIVGAPRASPGGLLSAGSAYLYSGITGGLLHQLDGQGVDDRLGVSVSGAGDIDGDGFGDVIVGAPKAGPGGRSQAGLAYLYSGATGALLHQFSGQAAYDALGDSVSGAGDVDGDGFDDVIFGAPFADSGSQSDVGSAYVYSVAPYMTVDAASLSATVGGRVNFFLDFPDSEAGEGYVLLGSLSGTGPWTVPGGCVPLTFDAFTQRMAHSPPPIFFNTAGTLGAGGTAQAWLDAPPGRLSGYVGTRVWFAAVAFDTTTFHLASVAIPIEIEL